MADHAQVVADEQIRQPQILAQLREQVDHLCLDGNIQRRHGLVADDDRGLERQCAGDTDALALSARELVRIALRIKAGSRPTWRIRPATYSALSRESTMPWTTGLPDDVLTRMRGLNATHTDPGRSSAHPARRRGAARPPSAPPARRAMRSCRRKAAGCRRPCGPAWIFRSRTRRQCPGPRRGHIQIDVRHRVHHLRAQPGAKQVGDASGKIDRLHEAHLQVPQRQAPARPSCLSRVPATYPVRRTHSTSSGACRQACEARGQSACETHSRRVGSTAMGSFPGIWPSGLPRVSAWNRRDQADRVRMHRVLDHKAALPVSTMRPAYITATRSVQSGSPRPGHA